MRQRTAPRFQILADRPRIVEYIVAHELVHLLVPNHGPEFWTRLERAMPDYEARRAWLAEEGAGYQ